MGEEMPLGRKEDLRLEFQSAAALERRERIGRQVAAMLNAEGGEIWLGVRDREGTAVELEPVADPEREADSVLESLSDVLEPSPLPSEVRVEPIHFDPGLAVLRIRLTPRPERRPYALILAGGWHFEVRCGRRIRPLARHEIRQLFRPRAAAQAEVSAGVEAAWEKVLSARRSFHREAREAMWLRLQPAAEIEVDLRSPIFGDLLADPARSGNRDIGWHFARVGEGPTRTADRICWRCGALEAHVAADGGMRFSAPLKSLHFKGEEREIWPLALLEYPISALRLAREIYGGCLDREHRVVADLAFFGLRGWKLRPGSPTTAFFPHPSQPPIPFPGIGEDLLSPKPLCFEYDEIEKAPDRCGYRLVRRVYEAFGFGPRQMPRDFDHRSGRLVLAGG